MPDSRSTSNYKAAHPRPATGDAKAKTGGEAASPAANDRRKQKFEELLHEGDASRAEFVGHADEADEADDRGPESRPADRK